MLRIASGDTVVTTTIDSAGVDQYGHKVNIGGNPQTGPFFITSANPGDVIAVRFDRVVPNRPYGHTSGRLAAHVVDPEFVFKLPGVTHVRSSIVLKEVKSESRLPVAQGRASPATRRRRLAP